MAKKNEARGETLRDLVRRFGPLTSATLLRPTWGLLAGPTLLLTIVEAGERAGQTEADIKIAHMQTVTVVRKENGEAIFTIKQTEVW